MVWLRWTENEKQTNIWGCFPCRIWSWLKGWTGPWCTCFVKRTVLLRWTANKKPTNIFAQLKILYSQKKLLLINKNIDIFVLNILLIPCNKQTFLFTSIKYKIKFTEKIHLLFDFLKLFPRLTHHRFSLFHRQRRFVNFPKNFLYRALYWWGPEVRNNCLQLKK